MIFNFFDHINGQLHHEPQMKSRKVRKSLGSQNFCRPQLISSSWDSEMLSHFKFVFTKPVELTEMQNIKRWLIKCSFYCDHVLKKRLLMPHNMWLEKQNEVELAKKTQFSFSKTNIRVWRLRKRLLFQIPRDLQQTNSRQRTASMTNLIVQLKLSEDDNEFIDLL